MAHSTYVKRPGASENEKVQLSKEQALNSSLPGIEDGYKMHKRSEEK